MCAPDAAVEAAIKSDNAPALRTATQDFGFWKRAYGRRLVQLAAFACIRAFIASGHGTLRYLAKDAARFSASPGLMRTAASLPQTAHVEADSLVSIIDTRTDLSDRQREDMRRAVVGMFYVN